MSITVTVAQKQGSTMGTVIAKVTEPGATVRDVNFYIRVLDGVSGELGPYPPDILRRPLPGVYEKDVVLDPRFETTVRTEVIQDDGSSVANIPVQTFGVRTPTAGGTGEVRVQDADTPETAASTLAFQGAVVGVANGVATFNLDGRYSQVGHTHDDRYFTEAESDGRYHPLNGAISDPQLSSNIPRLNGVADFTGGYGSVRVPAGLQIKAQDGISEGGEIVFLGAGTNGHRKIELFGGDLRFLDNVSNIIMESNLSRTNFRGAMFADRFSSGFDPGHTNAVACSNWFRSSGNSGWTNDTHGGGWFMSDGGWLRSLNDKGVRTGGTIYGGIVNGGRVWSGYDSGVAGSVSASGWFRSSGTTGWYNDAHGVGIAPTGEAGWLRLVGAGLRVQYQGITYAGGVPDDTDFGFYFANSKSKHYGLFREPGAWVRPVWLSFHTGINIGANLSYGGIQFWNGSYEDGRRVLFSVARYDDNVRIHGNSNLIFGPERIIG